MDQPQPPAAQLPRRVMWFAPWMWFRYWKPWKRNLALGLALLLAGYVASPGPVSYLLFRSELWWHSGVADVYYVVYSPLNYLRHSAVVDELYFEEFMLMERLFGGVYAGDMDQRVPPRPEFPD